MAAKDSSFDVVSEVKLHEVANAIDQTRREIATRFDFKNTGTTIEQDDDGITIQASTEDRLKAAGDVLKEKFVRREISLKALAFGDIEPAAKGTVRQQIKLTHGISDEKAREITKFVKGLPAKAQSQVMGEQVRITSKSRDDLQTVIRSLKEHDFGIPLQFTNYR